MNPPNPVLFTGGSGLLGRTLHHLLPNTWYPTSTELDITNYHNLQTWTKGKTFSVILHAAAFTSPPKVDQNPMQALEVNILGTANLVKIAAARACRLIYISTDYVFPGDAGNYREDDPVQPVNRYAWSKLGGECAVRLYDQGLIVRTSFGPEPFPYEKAFVDQWTSREGVTVIAQKILPLIHSDLTGVIHIGGARRTVHDYALSVSQGKKVGELTAAEVNFTVPRDTSLDCSRYQRFLDEMGRSRG